MNNLKNYEISLEGRKEHRVKTIALNTTSNMEEDSDSEELTLIAKRDYDNLVRKFNKSKPFSSSSDKRASTSVEPTKTESKFLENVQCFE